MICPGEMNREEKIKRIAESKKSKIENDIEDAKRCITLFVCSQCGLRIFLEQEEGKNSAYMSYDYEDYRVFFEDEPNFKLFENTYRNTNNNWSNWCNYICLECGNYVENIESGCENCGKGNIVLGKELGGKPCPICGTALNEGITIQGFETYLVKEREISNEWYNIYRERYHVEKPMPEEYTNEEIMETKRRETLREQYIYDDSYVINNSHNVLRFEFDDAFLKGSFYCILEWEDNYDGHFTLFTFFGGVWIEKNIDYKEVKQIITLLEKYNFFNKSHFKNYEGLDGYTFGLEVKYGQEYKELAIWGIRGGILYDIGMLLIQFAGKTFEELYEYAW
jgi:hypothetical protein